MNTILRIAPILRCCIPAIALGAVALFMTSCASTGAMKFAAFQKLPPFEATVEKIKVSPFSGSYYTSKRGPNTEVDVTILLRKDDGSSLAVRKRTFALSKDLQLFPPLRKLVVGKKYTFPTDIAGPDVIE